VLLLRLPFSVKRYGLLAAAAAAAAVQVARGGRGNVTCPDILVLARRARDLLGLLLIHGDFDLV
jgi:hypothetical protein